MKCTAMEQGIRIVCCCVYLLHCSLHHIPQSLSLRVLTLNFASSFHCHFQNIIQTLILRQVEMDKVEKNILVITINE